MGERVYYRVRDLVTEGWKLAHPDGSPINFGSRESAAKAAQYLKRWRLVKVTIRPRSKPNGGNDGT